MSISREGSRAPVADFTSQYLRLGAAARQNAAAAMGMIARAEKSNTDAMRLTLDAAPASAAAAAAGKNKTAPPPAPPSSRADIVARAASAWSVAANDAQLAHRAADQTAAAFEAWAAHARKYEAAAKAAETRRAKARRAAARRRAADRDAADEAARAKSEPDPLATFESAMAPPGDDPAYSRPPDFKILPSPPFKGPPKFYIEQHGGAGQP